MEIPATVTLRSGRLARLATDFTVSCPARAHAVRPYMRPRPFLFDGCPVALLEVLRHRAGAASTDLAAINEDKRHDLLQGTGQERLVNRQEIVETNRGFADPQTIFLGQLDHHIPSNSWQEPRA